MNRCLFCVTLLFSAALTTLVTGQDVPKAKPEVLPRVSALWNDMAQPMSVAPFVEKMTLKDALTLLRKQFQARHGRDLPMLINEQSFRDENPEAPDLNDAVVFLRPFPQVRTTGQILRDLLAQIHTGNATYFLKPGVIEITTFDAAQPSRLLRQTVDLKFTRQPLSFVLEEIYEQTGVHVVLDSRVGINARALVTITFTHDMALGTGLILVAEMAHLKLIETDNAIFITTPSSARKLVPTFQPWRHGRKDAAASPLPNPSVAGQ